MPAIAVVPVRRSPFMEPKEGYISLQPERSLDTRSPNHEVTTTTSHVQSVSLDGASLCIARQVDAIRASGPNRIALVQRSGSKTRGQPWSMLPHSWSEVLG